MEEVRVEDIEGGGIRVNLRCCGYGKFCTDNGEIDDQVCFIPTEQLEQDISQKIHCSKCKQYCEIYYSDGCYGIQLPGLTIVYNPGKEICLAGRCDCQNNALKDDFTQKICDSHYVDSQKPGEYTFSCPCGKTRVFVREGDRFHKGGHFHICREGTCPILSPKQREKQ